MEWGNIYFFYNTCRVEFIVLLYFFSSNGNCYIISILKSILYCLYPFFYNWCLFKVWFMVLLLVYD